MRHSITLVTELPTPVLAWPLRAPETLTATSDPRSHMSAAQDPPSGQYLLFLARAVALAILVTLAVLFASAGVLVQDGTGLDVHGGAALTIHILTGLLALTLAILARVRKAGIWAAVTGTALFGLTFAQASLGSSATLSFHIGGSLVIAATCTWLTAWTFRPGTSPPGVPLSPPGPAPSSETRRSS